MRLRQQIIDLSTGKVYDNIKLAIEDTNISRHFIKKSIERRLIIKNRMFAFYSYGMDIINTRKLFKEFNK